jgi:uncharacterized membrane protein YfcA
MTAAGLLLAGFFSGVIGVLLGLGGGVFLIPALVLLFHTPMRSAAGMGLVAVIATSSAGASRNLTSGLANVRLGVCLEPMTVMGSLCGGLLAPFIPARALIGLFAVLLFSVSFMLLRGARPAQEPAEAASPGRLGGTYLDKASGKTVSYRVRNLPYAMGASWAAGAASALLGVGGGLFKVPAMRLLCGVPMKAATATSNLMIGVTAASGAVLYLGRGDVPIEPAGTVALGVLAGSQAGHWLSARLSDRGVTRAFSLVTLAAALEMLGRALGR